MMSKEGVETSSDNVNAKIPVNGGSVDININEKSNVLPSVFEMKENGATYGVGFEMLKGIRKFFRLFLKSKNNPLPTLLLWYKGLSKDEKKTVMIICKERTENDSSSREKRNE
ncbi:MAG TPA: hypothetical protein VK543_06445 [Puia sp.]|nr:hypothetical protein [Puia sp.]